MKADNPRTASSRKASTRRKPAAKKKKKKTDKGLQQLLRRLQPGWPAWLGAAVVAAICTLIYMIFANRKLENTTTPPEGYTVQGIDVSHHQGAIDWELLRNQASIDGQPLAFVFIKATEGADMVDSRFQRNFSEARKHGLVRGAYHFFRAATPAKQQAENFIRQVQLLPGDLPPVLDVEVKPANVGIEEFRQAILEWLLRVEQHYRVKPILYTYHSFRQQFMNDSLFNLFPYWIAHYHVDTLRYRGPWAFWQYSDSGQLPGISEKVDMNVFSGSYDDLLRLTVDDHRTEDD